MRGASPPSRQRRERDRRGEAPMVEGVCADCWRPKRQGAHTFDRPPRTEPLFDWGSYGWSYLEIRLAVAAVVGVVALVVALVFGLR